MECRPAKKAKTEAQKVQPTFQSIKTLLQAAFSASELLLTSFSQEILDSSVDGFQLCLSLNDDGIVDLVVVLNLLLPHVTVLFQDNLVEDEVTAPPSSIVFVPGETLSFNDLFDNFLQLAGESTGIGHAPTSLCDYHHRRREREASPQRATCSLCSVFGRRLCHEAATPINLFSNTTLSLTAMLCTALSIGTTTMNRS